MRKEAVEWEDVGFKGQSYYILPHAKVAEMRTPGDFLIDVEYIIHRAGN